MEMDVEITVRTHRSQLLNRELAMMMLEVVVNQHFLNVDACKCRTNNISGTIGGAPMCQDCGRPKHNNK